MLVKSGEGMHEYRVIRNGVGEILMVNKFGPDETANRCKMVAELNLAPGSVYRISWTYGRCRTVLYA